MESVRGRMRRGETRDGDYGHDKERSTMTIARCNGNEREGERERMEQTVERI